MHKYDVYLILNYKEWENAKKTIPYVKKNLGARNVFVVSSRELLKQDIGDCSFIDENEVFYGLSYSSVKNYLSDLGALTNNTGWYLQQFIKFAIAYICKDDYYLVWDADTVPLNKLSFFDENGKPYFNLKREYFFSYFKTIKNLFNCDKLTKESFISEHMLFNKAFLIEMLDSIDNNQNLKGDNFWQKILHASDLLGFDYIKKDQRFFSEFETYGTYMDNFHPEVYSKRKLRTLRFGADFLGIDPDEQILEWASKDFDTISFEAWCKPIKEFIDMAEDEEFRKKYSFADAIRLFFKTQSKQVFVNFPRINHDQVRYFYEVLNTKTGFDFFFGDEIHYGKKQNILEKHIIDRIGFLYTNKCRIQRYWRLLFYRF